MKEETDVEERVEELLRRPDGPVVIRTLRPQPASGPRSGQVLVGALFALLVLISGAAAVRVISGSRQQGAGAPRPPTVPPEESTAPASPTATFGADFATADEAAAAIRQALERPDGQLLLRTIAPSGWYARWYEQTQTDPMSGVEAWGWILNSANSRWRVDASNIRDADSSMPLGDKYITAVAIDFNGWSEQRAAIMLRSIGGRWYWSSLLLYRPPPLGALAGDVAGYATLLNTTDATVTVRFRTVGSRCCSDQTWNERVVVLRRDATTFYMKPGGVEATSLADSGADVGADVWVRFRLDTLESDGTYQLADLVKMYP
jgi:hypothetical protein